MLEDSAFYTNLYEENEKNDPTPSDIEAIVQRCTKDEKSFDEYISFVDSFKKEHPIFRFFTCVHLILGKDKRKYEKYFELWYNALRKGG